MEEDTTPDLHKEQAKSINTLDQGVGAHAMSSDSPPLPPGENEKKEVDWIVGWDRGFSTPHHEHALIIWAFAFLLHIHSLWGSFIWDDRAGVINNPDVLGTRPLWAVFGNDFWGASLTATASHKSYRPLTTITFRLNFYLSQFLPMGYHFINIMLHATTCTLVLLFARRVFGGQERPSLLAALLYVSHPLHVESVVPIVGRADLLCGCFYFLAVITYVRPLPQGRSSKIGWWARSLMKGVVAYLLGLASFLSKEVGLSVFALFLVHDMMPSLDHNNVLKGAGYTLRQPMVALRALTSILTVIGIMSIRAHMHGEQLVMKWSKLENEIPHMESRLSRCLAVAHTHFVYLWKLVFPFRQSYDYGFACIYHPTTVLDRANLLSLATYLLLAYIVVVLIIRDRIRQVVWPTALLIASFLPASHLVFWVGAVVAERLLYIPSAGFCLLMAYFADRWAAGSLDKKQNDYRQEDYNTSKNSQSIERDLTSNVFLSEKEVFYNGYLTCPKSAKVLNNYALHMLNTQHAGEVVDLLDQAIDIYPAYSNGHYNKGLAHHLLGEQENAIYHMARTLQHDYNTHLAYAYMGQFEMLLHDQLGRDENNSTAKGWGLQDRETLIQRAAEHLDVAVAAGVQTANFFHARGSTALAMGKPELAVYFLEKALEVYYGKSDHQAQWNTGPYVRTMEDNHLNIGSTYNQMGLAYKAMGSAQEALEAFTKGLEAQPGMFEIVVNIGILYLDGNYNVEAKQWLDKALEGGPGSPIVLNNLGILAERAQNFHQARRYYMKALELSGSNSVITNNLARVEAALQGLAMASPGPY